MRQEQRQRRGKHHGSKNDVSLADPVRDRTAEEGAHGSRAKEQEYEYLRVVDAESEMIDQIKRKKGTDRRAVPGTDENQHD